MRIFFAVDFSDSVRGAIQRAIRDFPVTRPPWRWVAASNLHMTLKFLGHTPEENIPALSECADATCEGFASFSIRLGRLGAFPSLRRPRVLFYRVEEGAESLELLARQLDESLSRRLGIPREKHPFRAHATIARIKTDLPPQIIEGLGVVPPLGDTVQTVEKLCLMKSQLHPKGAIYHCLKEFALSKGKC
jgi:2'-5' RNA ligase